MLQEEEAFQEGFGQPMGDTREDLDQIITDLHSTLQLPATPSSYFPAFPQKRLASCICNWTFQPYQKAGRMFVSYGLNIYFQHKSD